jgi:phage shock protein C
MDIYSLASPKRVLAVQGVNMDSTRSKKLYRGKTWIAGGVCSGIADYYGFKKGGVQAAFVIGSFFFGVTVLIYILLWAILPTNPALS